MLSHRPVSCDVSLPRTTIATGFPLTGARVSRAAASLYGPAGPYKDAAALYTLAPVSGKHVEMVVRGRDTSQLTGRWDSIYVNLGTKQGVKVGDYFRIFRYQGTRSN